MTATTAPQGTDDPDGRDFLPALDGLRGLTILAVLAYHAGFSQARGGYLGISTFFTLSGFLITRLLLAEHRRTGRVDLRAFWTRRIRRLLPAALGALGLVALYAATVADRVQVEQLRGDVLAVLTYVTNWRFVVNDVPYVAVFADPSPVQHYWSLAVEEQFYVVWPLVLVGVLAFGRGRRWLLGATAAAGIVASTVTMAVLQDPSADPLRTYLGTDTRGAELLVGALLAIVLAGPAGGSARRIPWVARSWPALGALAALLGAWSVVERQSDALYRGGFLAVAAVSGAVVVAAAAGDGPVARLLSPAPLRWLGRISYGLYLVHWPIFLWLDPARTGFRRSVFFAVATAVSVAVAALSHRLLELPIRYGSRLRGPAAATALACGVVFVSGCVVAATMAPPPPPFTVRASEDIGPPPDDVLVEVASAPVPSTSTTATTVPTTVPVDSTTTTAAPTPTTDAPTATTTAAAPVVVAPRLMVVGDSVASNLGAGLTRWSERTSGASVWDTAVFGCGVARGGEIVLPDGTSTPPRADCDGWPSRWAAQLDEWDPDLVVIHTGSWELNDRVLPGETIARRPGDPLFDAWILSEYVEAVTLLRSRGAHLLWLTTPCVRFPPDLGQVGEAEATARARHINTVVLPQLVAATGIEVYDLYRAACAGDRVNDNVGGIAGARPDGVHFSDPAADYLAERIAVAALN